MSLPAFSCGLDESIVKENRNAHLLCFVFGWNYNLSKTLLFCFARCIGVIMVLMGALLLNTPWWKRDFGTGRRHVAMLREATYAAEKFDSTSDTGRRAVPIGTWLLDWLWWERGLERVVVAWQRRWPPAREVNVLVVRCWTGNEGNGRVIFDYV